MVDTVCANNFSECLVQKITQMKYVQLIQLKERSMLRLKQSHKKEHEKYMVRHENGHEKYHQFSIIHEWSDD